MEGCPQLTTSNNTIIIIIIINIDNELLWEAYWRIPWLGFEIITAMLGLIWEGGEDNKEENEEEEDGCDQAMYYRVGR